MRNTQYLNSRLLIVAVFALAALMSSAGCKSTTTRDAPASPTAPRSAPPRVATTDDATLAGRVKQALAADPALRSATISVATYRGVVQLSGYVDSQAQILEALAVAHGVAGVQSVSNELEIKPQ
ncbi:BON domain-containing protein [Paraburkholderia sp. MMS20-SJTR3]|uniref:BON domain-containing protein n=1 Tax=Paraburkholderia sejongensis TaxID=2886946 RepID=A0ABS8JSV3_9BURK|nr:BON domain-containing protein [Paraburkholderia sp. MMS20-SJTR3]MCC8392995.1 BON domain-containing protein [Paraburkholderia sp. MMS20-SJTR3]